MSDASAFRFAPGTRVFANGLILVGGSPRRVLRLAEGGALFLGTRSEKLGLVRPSALPQRQLCERLVDAGVLIPVPNSETSETSETSEAGRAKVDVVIPVFDDLEGLQRTVGDLAASADLVAEIFVVDDASTSPIHADSLAGRVPVTVLRHTVNRGPAAARNTGWAASSARWVLFLDSGVSVSAETVHSLVAMAGAAGAAMVAPRVRSRRMRSALAVYERDASPLDLGGATTRVRRGGPIGYVPSTALLSSRDMLQSLGGFDESLRFGEDVDLVWRCEESGQPVWYLGEAEVEHPPRPGLRSAALQRFRYGRSAASLDARHPGSATPAAVSLWSLGGWVLTLRRPLAGLLALLGMSAAVASRLPEFPDAPVERVKVGCRLGVEGNLAAGWGLVKASVRPWFPLLLVLGARRKWRAALVPLVAVPAVEYLRDRRTYDAGSALPGPVWIALRLGDHLAYSSGVWVGAVTERRPGVLLPKVVELDRRN